MNTITNDALKSLGIYCHIPFCVKKCAYCDFSSFSCQDHQTVDVYFKALHQEIKRFRDEHKDTVLPMVDTVYFGGGTPSAVPPIYIESTMDLLKEVFSLSEGAEITIEINPGTLTMEKANRYQAAGINRVSVGLQAWQDFLLKILGRVHNQADFIESMKILKAAGFKNFSVDVMYGLPGQKLEDVMETLNELLAYAPTHLSCYSLILEEGTPMANWVAAGQLDLPSEELEREMHWAVDGLLKEQGYTHYEISSYCKLNCESRHNIKYWELVPYLGFGLGAHGYYNGVRYGNANDLKSYCDLIEAGKSPGVDEPEMTKTETMSEWMFLGLRKLGGVDDREFKQRFDQSFFDVYQDVVSALIEDGLLTRDGTMLKLTPKGQDFGNQVFMAFI